MPFAELMKMKARELQNKKLTALCLTVSNNPFESTAWNAGARAALDKQGRTRNPYPSDSWEHLNWVRGFEAVDGYDADE